MGYKNGDSIVTNGLILSLDSADKNSYAGSGTSWFDLSGNNKTATLVSSPTFDSANNGSLVFGNPRRASFADNLFNVANGTDISELTIDAWVMWTAFPSSNYDEIISWWAGASSTVGFLGSATLVAGTAANPAIRFSDSWTSTGAFFTASSDVGKWWNLTGVKSTTNGFIYRQGNLLATKGSSMNFTVNRAPHLAARGDGAGEYMNGKIASIKIYNRALSATEILQNYNAQKSRFGL